MIRHLIAFILFLTIISAQENETEGSNITAGGVSGGYEKLSKDNAAILIVDIQAGLASGIGD
jgi:hypothetical protein